ncbi:MAG: hypothetical protein J6T67_01015 [Paludibacteraceae bacterium]|nr:hypothetical protein [Paludibacteraceae bacterium]
MGNQLGINIAGKPRAFHWVLLVMLGVALTACSGHHISFKLDEYAFIDQKLKENIESVIAVQFGKEPDVPLDIYFRDPNGMEVSPYDYGGKAKYSRETKYDIQIFTHHHEYYGRSEDGLQERLRACCVLGNHICYVYPDGRYLRKTGQQQNISFSHDDNAMCACSEDEVWLNIVNHNEVQIVQSLR